MTLASPNPDHRSTKMASASTMFSSAPLIFGLAFLLRFVLLFYGVYQDSVSALKYTDIDYYVFTDAARAVSRGSSPYDRATYRYTPLLAWILLPATWGGLWFQFGKAVFAISDLVAGWLITRVLKRQGYDKATSLNYASVWLLNPMVANISTRGSSEGLLCVLVMALLWSFESNRIALSGVLLGLSVHFKIYPFIYGASMLWALAPLPLPTSTSLVGKLTHQLTRSRLTLLTTSLLTFTFLNTLMYTTYGPPFLQHTYLHHLTRLDHRHNFSPYNTLLYLSSSGLINHTHLPASSSLAFLPQLLLSTLLIPLATSRLSLPATMLAQTLAFVTFNKVCTSQYFLWYLIFLPIYLPTSSLLHHPRLGFTALALWVLSQGLWLQQGYQLEFLGQSTFVPGLWLSSLLFFAVNCWILGIVVDDTIQNATNNTSKKREPATIKDSSSTTPHRKIDRQASVNGTAIGRTHLGPRNRILGSSPGS